MVRPSSLPLPKTLARSNPADRLSASRKRGATPPLREASDLNPGLYRATLRKLSVSAAVAESEVAAGLRQVKSLTPDREQLLSAKATPAIRKANSTKGIAAKAAESKKQEAENKSKPSTPRTPKVRGIAGGKHP